MSTMNRPFLLFAVFCAVSILISILSRLFRRSPLDRMSILLGYVQKRGYRLVNPNLQQATGSSRLEMLRNPALRNLESSSADIIDIDGLANGTGDWFGFVCTLAKKEVTIFNLSVTPRAGADRSVCYKVAKINAPGLPRFSLGRKSGVHTLLDTVDRMVGQGKANIALDPAQYPGFSDHHWLQGNDEAAVRAFLSPAKADFVRTANLSGTISTNSKYLVYFEDGVMVSEEDFDFFIANAEKVAGQLL